MLLSLHRAACTMDCNYTIHAFNEAALPIIHMPHQHTTQQFQEYGIRARNRACTNTRSCFNGLHEVDTNAYHAAMTKLNNEDRSIINNIATGGKWCAKELYDVGQCESPACQLCGGVTGWWAAGWWDYGCCCRLLCRFCGIMVVTPCRCCLFR